MDSIKKKTKNALIKGLRAAKRAEMRAERTLKRRLGYDVPPEKKRGPYVHPWTQERPGSPKVVDGLAKQIREDLRKAKDFEFCVERRKTEIPD